ncbi:7363_t:CDS:2 [Ambispora gerdemannii]|uniref:7363_t:CDS:1 n=1 Tax=Ambispora gerdemannii TaxID=144530 RepID=A0A9N9B420_9GLOM|nr:7363_t:CDS:2 [Ambispora gerdemannii]
MSRVVYKNDSESCDTCGTLKKANAERKENAKIPELEKKFADIKSENLKLKQIIKKNVKHDVRVDELEQKNKELEARLAVVEQSSVAVDGQLQNDSRSEDSNASKEVILEILPEVSADDDSIVDQLKQHAPVCKANDMVSEVLPEETVTNLSQSDYVYTNTSEVSELEQDDEIDVVDTNQIIEQGLIQELNQN